MTSSMIAEAWEIRKKRAQNTFWNQFSIWSKTTAWIIKKGLKLTMPISNIKAGNFSMPTWFFDANYPLRINSTSVVRKRKLRTQGNFFRRATKRRQIFNIASHFDGQMSRPVYSRVIGPAPQNCVSSPIAPIFGNISSLWRRIDCS
jgi:hypothetical protein